MAGEWLTATVESLSRIVCSGGTPRTGVADYYDGGSIPWVTTTEVDYNRIVQTDKCITEAGLAASSAKMVPPGTVIVAMYGRGTAGRVAMAGVPLTTNQACCNLVVDETQADARFVYYSLWSNFSKLDALANGSVQQNLSAGVIRAFEILVPPLSEQRAIAHILGTLDDKIELNRRMARTLEDMARALFKAWFVDFEPVRAKMDGRWRPGESLPGLPAHLYDLFPDRLVDSELGEIPEGWEVQPVGGLADVVGGTTPSTKVAAYWEGGTHCWATPKDLAGLAHPVLLGTERHVTDSGLSKTGSGLLPAGTVLLSSRAPIGYLAVAEVPVAINQGFIAMRPKQGIASVFLLMWAEIANDEIMSRANGSTFLEISKGNFRPIPVVVPSESVMRVFEKHAGGHYSRIVECVRQTQVLTEVRNALLPRLVSGEVRVTDPGRILMEVGRSDA